MITEPTLNSGFEVQDGHLGGCWSHGDPATWTPHVWSHFIEELGVKSVVDIGCGTGLSMAYFKEKGCDVLGIEGARAAIEEASPEVRDRIIQHDFQSSPLSLPKNYDLAWTAEFVEHVEAQFIPNFVEVMKSCKFVAMTYAIPGQGGYHHVNEQPREYWIDKIESFGFVYDDDLTVMLQHLAMRDEEIAQKKFPNEKFLISHFGRKGLVFRNPDLKE